MKHIEKILFLLGLAGAVLLYFKLSENQLQEPEIASFQRIEVAQFSPIEVPTVTEMMVEWSDPVAQSEDGLWLFDVFTPPRIFINPETGEMEPTPYAPPPPPPAFGLQLVEIKRDSFRVQLDGYIERDVADPSTSILVFLDIENQIILRSRVGEELPDMDIRVDDFSVERVLGEEVTTVLRVPRVTITDLRNNQTLTMTTGERIFGKEVEIHFSHDSVPGERFVLKEVGEILEVGEERFEILDINFTNQSVRVRKTSPLLEEAEEATLSVQRAPAQRQTQQPTPLRSQAEDSDFPAFF